MIKNTIHKTSSFRIDYINFLKSQKKSFEFYQVKKIKPRIQKIEKLFLIKNSFHRNLSYNWRKVKNKVIIIVYYFTLIKYTRESKRRDKIFKEHFKKHNSEIELIRIWLSENFEVFFREFIITEDLRINFLYDKGDQNFNYVEILHKIGYLFKILINCLKKAIKLMPETVKFIIRKYISSNCYFPINYLTFFEVNRLDFDFNGKTKELEKQEYHFIISYLIIVRVIIQKILLSNLNNTNLVHKKNSIGFSSFIYYLVKSYFQETLPRKESLLKSMNYLRNYKIFNLKFEINYKNYRKYQFVLNDEDKNLSKELLDEEKVKAFFFIEYQYKLKRKLYRILSSIEESLN